MSEPVNLRAHLSQAAPHETVNGVDVVCLSCRVNGRSLTSEDRYFAAEWALSNGLWKLVIVLDGHGGTATVDFVLENLPSKLQTALVSALEQSTSSSLDDDTVAKILSETLIMLDEWIKDDFLSLIPSEDDALLSFDAAVALRDTSGKPHVAVERVMSGTTAAVALVDPSNCVHTASVGDCDLFLCSAAEDGGWHCLEMGYIHCCKNPIEEARIMAEHPGEPDCVSHKGVPRLLGALTLSRAIGDTYFNLPIPLLRFLAVGCNEPEAFQQSFLELVKTPPYLSNVPKTAHAHITGQRFLILSSDGLVDFMRRRLPEAESQLLGKICAAAAARAHAGGQNLAAEILWEAMGGDGEDNICVDAVAGNLRGRVDDITVAVLPL